MLKSKKATTLLVSLILVLLLSLKLSKYYNNEIIEFGFDILIIVLLLTFYEQILLLTLTTIFGIYKKLVN